MERNTIMNTYDVESTVTDKLYRVGRLFRAKANGFFKARGVAITAEQWGILLRLSEKKGRSQRALASRIFQDHPNITRLVDKLESRKLIQRRPDPDDRRSHLLFLTSEGKALVETLLPDLIAEKSEYYKDFDERDIELLSDMLSRIEERLIAR